MSRKAPSEIGGVFLFLAHHIYGLAPRSLGEVGFLLAIL